MSPRTIQVLHVEDDAFQQRAIQIQLASMPEYAFALTVVDSEDGAVAEFGRKPYELVILDYHLSQGNGLSCLRKLRDRDRIVPIVAISGAATPEVAAELVQVGADDYLSKQSLTPEALAQSVRGALARADAWRREAAPRGAETPQGKASLLFDALCAHFTTNNGPELLRRLDAFEEAARQAKWTASQLEGLFAADGGENDRADRQRLLRPLLLEVLVRLFGDTSSGGSEGN